MNRKRFSGSFFKACVLVSTVTLFLGFSSIARAASQWTALPPYNTLWPLWSPVLSPVDSSHGVTHSDRNIVDPCYETGCTTRPDLGPVCTISVPALLYSQWGWPIMILTGRM
ncbi:MAG: hypothetical protein AB1847_12095 [bacterium]